MPAVTVVVPARDAAGTLPACLDAIAAQQLDGTIEVIVADDGSRDTTRAIAQAHPAVARVVATDGVGPGAARNAAAAQAAGPVLAFTDADCVPGPRWLAEALAALGAGADVVQGAVVPAGPAGPWDRTVSVQHESPLFETANLVLRREWFERVGGFEAWLSPRRSKELGEDVWLGWRLRRAGARCVFAPDAVVAHAVFPGTPATHVAERLRLRFFPEMAARIPELREALFFRRRFLTRRSAAFDLAAAGVVAAAVTRRPVALAAALPYARQVWRSSRSRGRDAPRIAAVEVAADAVGAAALATGSVRARSILL